MFLVKGYQEPKTQKALDAHLCHSLPLLHWSMQSSPRTIRTWNHLPGPVVEIINPSTFREAALLPVIEVMQPPVGSYMLWKRRDVFYSHRAHSHTYWDKAPTSLHHGTLHWHTTCHHPGIAPTELLKGIIISGFQGSRCHCGYQQGENMK